MIDRNVPPGVSLNWLNPGGIAQFIGFEGVISVSFIPSIQNIHHSPFRFEMKPEDEPNIRIPARIQYSDHTNEYAPLNHSRYFIN